MHSQSPRRAPRVATYLRSAEVAATLQVSPKTIVRRASQGLLPYLPYLRTLGGHRRYPEPAIRELATSLRQKVRAS
jgi:predicted site-specific integrase-resolvase